MPSKMPPQLLTLLEEFKARAAIAAQRNAADTTKHTGQITQHPPITAVDIERMKQELGFAADPNAKPFSDGGVVHMLGGGLLGQAKVLQRALLLMRVLMPCCKILTRCPMLVVSGRCSRCTTRRLMLMK